MGGNIRLGRLFGIPIEINVSWFLIAWLVAYSLSSHVFPDWQPGLTVGTYWLMGLATSLAFFGCLLLHELAHSVMSRRYGLEVRRITLFLFGGVSESVEEMPSPRAEFWIAVVGPLTSLALAGLFTGLGLLAEFQAAPPALYSALGWLGLINGVLAIFNLIPGFPLDGGRLFRAAVWAWTGDLNRATRWASWGGQAFAAVLAGFGIARLLSGNWLGGFWLIFIGWLLYSAAEGTYVQVTIKRALDRLPVKKLMSRQLETLTPDMALDDVIEQHFLRQMFASYPVVRDGQLVGLLGRQQVREVPREAWPTLKVADVMVPLAQLHPLQPGQGAGEALEQLGASRLGRLPVIEDGNLVGLLSQTDVVRYLIWHGEGNGQDFR